MAAEATASEVATARSGGGDLSQTRRRQLLAALAITQTVGYGVLFYAFSVFLTPVAADLHTGITTVAAALTCGIIVTGVAAVPIGRWIDRHGARALMTGGSIVASLAVAAWSQVHTVAGLFAVFVLLGAASAAVLYEPAFAVIIDHLSPARRSGALLTVTVVAGFASSIFIPVAGWLNANYGWRHALLVLAAVHLAATAPLHALAVPAGRRVPSSPMSPAAPGVRHEVWNDRGFWLLATAFTAQGAAVATIGVHLVSYLIRLGHPPAIAALVAGLLGVLSVTGRLVTTGLRRRYPIASITAAVFAVQAVAAITLPAVGASTTGAVACVVLFGLGFGVATIARPALLADRYGTTRYATISGAMTLPMNVAKAAAPLVGAAIAASRAGDTALMAAVAGCCAMAATALLAGPG